MGRWRNQNKKLEEWGTDNRVSRIKRGKTLQRFINEKRTGRTKMR